MTPELVMTIGRQAVEMTLILSGPLLLAALVIGLIISIFQAATQINEQTLSFLPRLMVTLLALALSARWLVTQLMDFCVRFFQYASTLLG